MISNVNNEVSLKTLQRLLSARVETELVDFKEMVDLTDRRSIIELAKDVLAFANTRGGHIVIGVADQTFIPVGIPTAHANFLQDSVNLNNLLKKYTGGHVSVTTALHRVTDVGGEIVIGVIYVPKSRQQIPAVQDGAYPNPKDASRPLTVFHRGDLFVRKSSSSCKVESPADLRPGRPIATPKALIVASNDFANPYDFSRAVTGALFKGRQREIDRLFNHLENGTHVAVHGLQRMGKTSLIREAVRNRVPSSGRLSKGFIFAEVELQQLGSDRLSYKELLEKIVASLVSSLGPRSKEVRFALDQYVAEHGGLQRGRSSDFLQAYEKAFEMFLTNLEQPAILFLDEFSELCRKIEKNERLLDEHRFRGVEQHPNEMLADVALMRFFSSLFKNPKLKNRLTVVLAVRPFVSEFDRSRDAQILKLTAPVALHHLEETAAKALIEDPVKGVLKYQAGAVDYLYRLTAGHPYLIQFMLNELVSEALFAGKESISLKSIKALEERMVRDGPAYDAQFEVLDSDYSVDEALFYRRANIGRGVLSLIARNGHVNAEGWVLEEEVLRSARNRGLDVSSTSEILDQLHRAGIIQEKAEAEEMYYRVAIPLLRKRYVSQNLYMKYFKSTTQ